MHATKAALPPIVGRGWVGEDQVGKKGRAKLGDCLVAPEVMGKAAIDPWQPYLVAPVGGCKQPADGVLSPPCSQTEQSGEGNVMVLTPQRTWVRVPSTLANNHAAALVDFPPPNDCKGHKVARGVCHWGHQQLHAPLLVVRRDWCQ
jgi:hypothetical protein